MEPATTTASSGDSDASQQRLATDTPQGSPRRLDGLLRRNSATERSHNDKLRKLDESRRLVDAELLDMRRRLFEIENTLVELVHAAGADGKVAVGDAENGFQMLALDDDEARRRGVVCCACWAACLDMFCQ